MITFYFLLCRFKTVDCIRNENVKYYLLCHYVPVEIHEFLLLHSRAQYTTTNKLGVSTNFNIYSSLLNEVNIFIFHCLLRLEN